MPPSISATALPSFTNLNPNQAPVAVADSATTAPNTAVVVNVISNDADVDGNTLTPLIVGQGSKGAAVVNPNKTITYTPRLNATGVDTFTYRDSDGQAFSNVAAVTVTIGPANQAPVAIQTSLRLLRALHCRSLHR